MVFQFRDFCKFSVYTVFHCSFHSVTSVLQCLLLEVVTEKVHNLCMNVREHGFRLFATVFSHCTDYVFQQKEIFHFSHLRHKNFLISQVFHFLGFTSVTVHNSITVKVVKSIKVIKSSNRFYHLIATAERLYRKLRENERIKFGVYRMLGISLNKKHRFSGTDNGKIHIIRQTGIVLKYRVSPTV